MIKVYYLKTCSTCSRILNELNLDSTAVLQDIKTNTITLVQLEEMQALSGSYESLFSRRAQLYKQRGLKDKSLSENDFKNLILEHYTFLSRPVIIVDNSIFIGNSKSTIEKVKQTLNEK